MNERSAALARCALEVLRTEWPHKLDHLILAQDDLPPPREIHPVFFGCYDWHSSVHMHWSLLRLRSRVGEGLRREIDTHFESRFTAGNVAREGAYAAHPARSAFERPYGWAWLLKLQSELESQALPWAATLAAFASDVSARLAEFLPRGPYPVRAGMHANSAFAMILAREYATGAGDARLLASIDESARRWFAQDADYPAAYEPGGADFLSPGLCEALLMSGVLGDGFASWWSQFDRDGRALRHWLQPLKGIDRRDPQLVHVAGLNLSRAWCLRSLCARLPQSQQRTALEAAQAHEDEALPYIVEGDFVATHWLVTFALLASS